MTRTLPLFCVSVGRSWGFTIDDSASHCCEVTFPYKVPEGEERAQLLRTAIEALVSTSAFQVVTFSGSPFCDTQCL